MQACRSIRIICSSILALFMFLAVSSGGVFAHVSTVIAQSERDVTYPGVHGVKLAGTLLVPAHPQGAHVPGVVIIAGSGAVDRNGNAVQAGVITNLYKQLAEDLAQHGIASLRYDKRGVGASTPVPRPKDPGHPTPGEIAAIQRFGAWNNYVGDAAASLNYLQHQPAIDSRRTALMGHSEGTVIAVQIASTNQDIAHPPAALVLLAAPGRPIFVLIREQIDHRLKQLKVSGSVEAFVLQQYDAIIKGFKQNGQIPQAPLKKLVNNPQVPAEIKGDFLVIFSVYNVLGLKGYLLDPAAMVTRYKGPVLIIQGESDIQVFAKEDTPLLDKALKRRPHDDHQVTLVPHASHELKYVQDPEKDPGIAGPVIPQVLTTLHGWLAKKL